MLVEPPMHKQISQNKATMDSIFTQSQWINCRSYPHMLTARILIILPLHFVMSRRIIIVCTLIKTPDLKVQWWRKGITPYLLVSNVGYQLPALHRQQSQEVMVWSAGIELAVYTCITRRYKKMCVILMNKWIFNRYRKKWVRKTKLSEKNIFV